MSLENSARRVPIALINNSVTPYRLDLHSRISREIQELEIWSLFTHEVSNAPWHLTVPQDIRPVYFGTGEKSEESGSIFAQPREWSKAGNILRWLKRQDVQGVVLGGYDDIGRLRILSWCRRNKVPCFLFADSNILGDRVSGLKRRLKHFILPRILRIASGVLCCGRLGEEYFGRYGVPPNLLFRFPYEPDYARLASVTGSQVEAARQTYGLSGNRRYLIYSGRLAPVKRVDLLLAAFDRISQLRPQWDLIVAGDGDERAPLQRSVNERIATRVIWTGFINEPESLRSLYAAANVLVLPSDYEPWGVVVTEAAVLMPVIASSVVGAAADVIIDGENGFIFEAGNVESLEQCLLKVTDETALNAMTKSAPVRFADWHDRSDPVKGLRAALQSVGIGP